MENDGKSKEINRRMGWKGNNFEGKEIKKKGGKGKEIYILYG